MAEVNQSLQERVAELEAIGRELWAIIDDIDTYSDMAKGNDAAYRALVEKRQRDRFKYGSTDGYDVQLGRPITKSDRRAVD